MRQFSAPELQQYLQQGAKPLLLDVREPWEFDICHIEDSKLISMAYIPRRIKELDKDQEIVVICHHGVRSLEVAQYMTHHGFSNIINLIGGVAAWAQEVDHDMPTY